MFRLGSSSVRLGGEMIVSKPSLCMRFLVQAWVNLFVSFICSAHGSCAVSSVLLGRPKCEGKCQCCCVYELDMHCRPISY